MICADTNCWIAYLSGDAGQDTGILDHAVIHGAVVMAPVVLSELLSDPQLESQDAADLCAITLLEIGPGYWERAGRLGAQRLAKRLCAKCKEPYVAGADEIRSLLTEYCQEMLNTTLFKADPQAGLQAVYADWSKKYVNDKGQFVLYKKKRCEVCNQSGYKGRAGLHELLVATDPIKKMVQEKARVAEILAVALEEGMRTLKMDGLEKVLQGVTDMAQVRAVCIK